MNEPSYKLDEETIKAIDALIESYKLKNPVDCPDCGGSGRGYHPEDVCPLCRGRGKVEQWT